MGYELNKGNPAADNGVWRIAEGIGVDVSCPKCGHISVLKAAGVQDNGTAGLACPVQGCKFSKSVTLLKWEPPVVEAPEPEEVATSTGAPPSQQPVMTSSAMKPKAPEPKVAEPDDDADHLGPNRDMGLRVCPVCNGAFEPKNARHKVCSPECRKAKAAVKKR